MKRNFFLSIAALLLGTSLMFAQGPRTVHKAQEVHADNVEIRKEKVERNRAMAHGNVARAERKQHEINRDKIERAHDRRQLHRDAALGR